jgi:dienelactone hydrolase
MKRLFVLVPAVAVVAASLSAGADPFRVLDDKPPTDSRLGKPKDLNGYFPAHLPVFLERPMLSQRLWEARKQQLREQVLVANGLWPMPEKTPLNAVIHGKIDREAYTVEKVFFASTPGHYVTGNLYRPKGKTGKLPGVLCPHGHWANGRFYEANDKTVDNELKSGAEKTRESARYPLQARCAMLARMGCVVFHYDMIGRADSMPIGHTEGFTDVEAELRLQSFMGLQTWNSIRALDFLLELPEVDAKRIGVTGASGGGTQTFLLCAVDDRPTVAAPAVMVSTGMQGGCICENCTYLRVDTGNVELAALFAPKPLLLIGADDWTVDIETKGYPELRSLYRLLGHEDRVFAKCNKQFKHNYNQVSREQMYNWFNKHLALGLPEPVVEQPFKPVPPKELSVFDGEHPLPKDAVPAEVLRKHLTEASDRQLAALMPKDEAGLKEYQRVVGTALRVMVGDRLPAPEAIESNEIGDRQEKDGLVFRRYLLSRRGADEAIPTVGLMGKDFDGTVVVWIHPDGKSSLWKDGKLTPAAQQIIDRKAAIFGVDVFLTGEYGDARPMAVNEKYAGYTFGYNRPLLANRVRDILTAVAFVKGHKSTKKVHLVGWEKAGPWAVLARALAGDGVERTAADAQQYRFESVKAMSDEMMLPGALKYGGLSAFMGLCAPHELYLHNAAAAGIGPWLKPAYQASGKSEKAHQVAEKTAPEKVVEWLLR